MGLIKDTFDFCAALTDDLLTSTARVHRQSFDMFKKIGDDFTEKKYQDINLTDEELAAEEQENEILSRYSALGLQSILMFAQAGVGFVVANACTPDPSPMALTLGCVSSIMLTNDMWLRGFDNEGKNISYPQLTETLERIQNEDDSPGF